PSDIESIRISMFSLYTSRFFAFTFLYSSQEFTSASAASLAIFLFSTYSKILSCNLLHRSAAGKLDGYCGRITVALNISDRLAFSFPYRSIDGCYGVVGFYRICRQRLKLLKFIGDICVP